MTYAGGKGGSGVYQKIISLMPPHRVYVECFLGNGSIFKHKKPAKISIGIEIDPDVFRAFNFEIDNDIFHPYRSNLLIDRITPEFDKANERRFFNKQGEANLLLFCHDAIDYLHNEYWSIEGENPKETLIYCDPPYLKSVRRSQRQIYSYDMVSEAEHEHLLETLLTLSCNVMISGYDSELYNRMLSDWRKVSFQGVSRAGATTECVWMNFPEPLELHDYSFLGDNHRQRLDIKRKKLRWINRLKKMSPQERYAFLSAFDELKSDQVTAETPLIERR